MFFTVMIVFHTLVCIGLVIVVLLQSAKGEGLAGSAFGGGGGGISNAVFGGRGAASFLSNATTVLAVVFFVNCIALAYMSAGTRTTGSATAADSTITQKAQAERERALQQQQLQQTQQGQDSLGVNILPNEAAPDTSGN